MAQQKHVDVKFSMNIGDLTLAQNRCRVSQIKSRNNSLFEGFFQGVPFSETQPKETGLKLTRE